MGGLVSRNDAAAGRPSPRGEPEVPVAVRRHGLVATVRHRLQSRCRVPAGAGVVVGCSGGADSMALLLACRVIGRQRVRGAAVIEPTVVHVHHHLRPEADADASFVAATCRELGLPCVVEHVHPAREPGSLAAAARTLRYDALARRAHDTGARFVAVAHHAEDQLETMLMSLGRGTGLDGLCGMDWVAPCPGDGAGVALVRPLLDVRKRDCEQLCRAAGIEWRDDPANLDPNQPRGRLRRDVLPVLDELWPDAAVRAGATADLLRAARDEIDGLLASAFGPPDQSRWPRRELGVLPVALVAAGLRRAALHLAPQARDDIGQRLLLPAAEAVRDGVRRPRVFDWPAGLTVHVTSREVRIDAGKPGP